MPLRSLVAIVFLLLAQAAWAAEDGPRVAILPLVSGGNTTESIQDSKEIADYVLSQLQDFPKVAWVDRADLNAMLEEKAVMATSDNSALAIGRLLKADVLIHIRYTAPGWEIAEGGGEVYRRHLTLEVTDLTNASILAFEEIALNSGQMDESDPGRETLKECADTARRLLTQALESRRRNASTLALAPLFFTNSGASPRLDFWEQSLIDRFGEVSGSYPGTTILRFRGAEEANREQELSLLGLTDADPDAWQKAANGYIWGSYHEMAPGKTTAFEDIQVDAELYLEMGGQPPQRFARTFPVKDFYRQSRAMVTDILRAAMAKKKVAPAAETGQQMGRAIFDHLCDWINTGFFARKPDDTVLMPDGFWVIGDTMETVFGPVQNLPFGDKKLDYCRRMLSVACFFDPRNARMQLLRATLSLQGSGDDGMLPDGERTNPDQYIHNLIQLASEPNYDPALFASAVRVILYQFGDDTSRTPGFFPLLISQTPLIIKALASGPALDAARSDASDWFRWLVDSSVNPEIKVQYLQAVWPYLGDYYQGNLSDQVEKLMTELGDRTRIQSILMKSTSVAPFPEPTPVQDSSISSISVEDAIPAWPDSCKEPLLEGLTSVSVPPPIYIELPLERILGLTADPEVQEHYPFGGSISSLDVFGDQLVIGIDVGGSRRSGFPTLVNFNAYCIYRVSTEQVETLEPCRLLLSCLVPGGRLLYRSREAIGYIDLLSGTGQKFSTTQGMPAEAPDMIGFCGDHYAALADRAKRLAGLYDWNTGKWLTPPSVPDAIAAAPVSEDESQDQGVFKLPSLPIVGTSDFILFPQWDLLYDATRQSWSKVPPQPKSRLVNPGGPFYYAPNAGSLILDGEVWRWNQFGILDFSPKDNQIRWQSGAMHLLAVAADGPYLWLSFQSFSESDDIMSRGSTGRLMLMDRASHRPLGMFAVPHPGAVMCVDQYHIWLGDQGLSCWEKTDLYSALGVPRPSLERPARPALRDADFDKSVSLYDALLRDDIPTAARLLKSPGACNTLLGRMQIPAVTVAVWMGDPRLVKLFLHYHPNLEAAPEVEMPAKYNYGPPILHPTDATPLVAAARNRDISIARLLLDAGARPTNAALIEAITFRNADVMEVLVKAGAPLTGVVDWIVRKGEVDIGKRILELNPNLSAVDRANLKVFVNLVNADLPPEVAANTAKVCGLIIIALKNKDEARGIALLRYITPASARTDEVRKCFIAALEFGSEKIVETLLQDGVSPDPDGDELVPGGSPPLAEALGHPEIELLLLHHGAHPRLLDGGDSLYIARVASSPSGPEVLPELLKAYPALNAKCGYGTLGGTLLCSAAGGWSVPNKYIMEGAALNPIKVVQLLLSKGVSPSESGGDGLTPLHAAFAMRNTELACALAGYGADPRCRDLAGRSVIDPPYVSSGRDDGFLEALENFKPSSEIEKLGQARLLAIIHARPTLEQLRQAVMANDLARVKDLLSYAASFVPPYGEMQGDEEEPTPGLVYIAVTHRAREIAEALIEHGCSPDVGALGEYGRDYATYNIGGNLTDQCCPLHWPRERCKTPLIAAAESGNLEMVKMLLKHGAYAPTQDEFHRNAIDAASKPEIAQYIRANTTAQFAAQQLFDTIGNNSVSPAQGVALVARIAQTEPAAFRVRNPRGFTPLTYPLRLSHEMMNSGPWDHIDSVAFAAFHKCGIKLTGLDVYGMTPLHDAVLHARVSDVINLLKLGFDPSVPDIRGITALDLAKGIIDDARRSAVLEALHSHY